jgi:LacI family transcriptional regulator, galactose operon repressor
MSQITIQDVADRAGVSIKTVSRVINDEDNIAAKTREKVIKAAAELGYVPNLAARRLALGKAMAIGLVLGWPIISAYASALIDSVLQACKNQGYGLVLFSVDEKVSIQVKQACLAKQVDGIIMDTITSLDQDLKKQLDASQAPYVIVHPNLTGGPYPASYVTIDDQKSAKTAVEYLIELGHKSIGFILDNSRLSQDRDRLSGYKQALAGANLPFRERLVHESSFRDFHSGLDGASHLMSANEDLSAIFCVTDEIAIGAMSAIWQTGRKIPDDISVIGFDDIRYASMVMPPLTTTRQPIAQVAEVAVNHLIEMIADPATEPLQAVLPTSLIIRETCKPHPQSERHEGGAIRKMNEAGAS